MRIYGTFSILAISPDSKLMGVAVASGSIAVGSRVPHAKPGVGVIATQAYTNVDYGISGLKLLSKGLTPNEALNKLLAEDYERNFRQVAIMDFKGRKAVFTGVYAPEFHGEVIDDYFIVIGNLLANENVVKSIAEKFKETKGSLAFRMAYALKAGSESGGDKRGEKSAALILVGLKDVKLKIRIDRHKAPIEELIRKIKEKI